ncbi:MAG: hypothetical protein OXH27_00215 [Gammaproteobacteria bacterium]|nr:hypothetical protein [Gammaproteobacteria bacterium]
MMKWRRYNVTVYHAFGDYWKGAFGLAHTPWEAARAFGIPLRTQLNGYSFVKFKPDDESNVPDGTIRVELNGGSRKSITYYKTNSPIR